MNIIHTYGIAEESGTWYVTIDGDITRNGPHRTAKAARRVAEKLTKANALWAGIFAIEIRIAEAFKDTPWPYGITCVNHGTDEDPAWVLTEPYRVDDEAVRAVNPDPTGYVQINVYTRDLYETACQIVGVEPDTDELIKEKFCDCGHGEYISEDIEPAEAVKMRLTYRRSIGISVEQHNAQNESYERLKEAGLLLDQYTRDQYTAACEIAEVPALTDDQVTVVVTIDIANDQGLGIVASKLPHDPASISLAYRRAMGINHDTTGDTDPDNSE